MGSSMVMMCSRALGVDVVDHGRQGRRLAGAGGARAEDQAALLVADLLQHDGQAQLPHGHDLHGDDAEHQAHRAPLLEDVAAEAAQAGHRVGDVDLEVVLELLLLAVAHDGERHGDGVLLHEALGLHQGDQLAVDAEHGVRPHLQVEVGGLALRRDLQQVVDVHTLLQASSPTPRSSSGRRRAASEDAPVGTVCAAPVAHEGEPAELVGDPALDDVEEGPLQGLRHRAARALSDGDLVHGADGRDLRRRPREEDLVGQVEHLAGDRAARTTGIPERSGQRDHGVAGDAGQDRRRPAAGVMRVPFFTRKRFSPLPSER